MPSIYRITKSLLRDDVVRAHLYADLDQEFYWDDSWDPEFYVELARAGFISIAIDDSELGPLLLPQLQPSYALLDWENLHYSRNLQRLLRSGRLEDEQLELRIVDSPERVLERLVAYHEENWILQAYQNLVLKLPSQGDVLFSVRGVELWSGERDELVAGEIGYTIGRTYTSLSGFCTPDEPALRHFGTLQMVLLAGMLQERGYAFWNLGHSIQDYKKALGARVTPRERFLERWLAARDGTPEPRNRR